MATPSRRIAVIGAGFSGLCLGIQLKQAGIDSFTIYEKVERLGGTWRDNTYPGAACDSASFSYCFSFEQKTDWTHKWSRQEQILAYMEHCAEKYALLPHMRFRTEIASAHFDEARGVWQLRTTSGEELEADVLVSSVGQLNRPATPDIEGLDRFRGACFHSARWDHEVALDGKRVGVIGNAASAVQFVPELAKQVGRLFVFQRSANWLLPRRNRAFTEKQKQRFARHPWFARLFRWQVWASYEARWPIFLRSRWLAQSVQRAAEKSIAKEISDPELRKLLIPDYPVGGKRILISDDYYQTLRREHVELVTAGIRNVSEGGIVTSDGTEIPLDVIVLGTGFKTTEFLVPMKIEGRGGRSLEKQWEQGPKTWLGIATAGFPNFFMTYGPNTNLGHNSILFMIECQTRYIVSCVLQIIQRDLAFMDLRTHVMQACDDELQRDLQRTVWAATPKSWYKNDAGRITNNWSGTTTRYWWRTRRPNLSDYELVERRSLSPRATTEPAAAAS